MNYQHDTYNISSELQKDEESYTNGCALPVALQGMEKQTN